MELTFGTGLFWLLLACTIGETIVRAARRRGRGDARDPTLQRRVVEVEATVAALVDARHAHDREIARLREQLAFTERLRAAPSADRALPE